MSLEQIARDIREGTFPRKSEATLREEAAAADIVVVLDNLRMKAFASNSDADKTAYFERLSQAFQRGELVAASRDHIPDVPQEAPRHYCATCCGDGKYDRRMVGLPPEADNTCVDCGGTGIEPAATSSVSRPEL